MTWKGEEGRVELWDEVGGGPSIKRRRKGGGKKKKKKIHEECGLLRKVLWMRCSGGGGAWRHWEGWVLKKGLFGEEGFGEVTVCVPAPRTDFVGDQRKEICPRRRGRGNSLGGGEKGIGGGKEGGGGGARFPPREWTREFFMRSRKKRLWSVDGIKKPKGGIKRECPAYARWGGGKKLNVEFSFFSSKGIKKGK